MKLNIRRNTAPGEEKRPLPGLLAEKIKSRLGGKPGKQGRVRRRLIAAVLVVAVMAGGGMYLLGGGQTAEALETAYSTAQVTRMDITSSITGSGTLEAADSYSVTTLLEDTILTADF